MHPLASARSALVGRFVPLLAVLALGPLAAAQAPVDDAFEGCSVGVACGRATADGRPLLWKNRDAKHLHNVVRHFEDGAIPYVALCNAGSTSSAWGGANAAGFCIMNSVSRDLAGGSEEGPGNGGFMKLALQVCASVDDFEALLERTADGARRTRANFGVIDTQGGAAFFETGHRHHVRFDARDAKSGILVRTNFATTADGERGRERFARADAICAALPGKRALSLNFLLDEFVRDLTPPPSAIAGEGGLQDVRETIHRQTTVASMVFQGVDRAEDAARTTMWAIVGQPLFSVAVPVWPAAGHVSPLLAGDPRSPICDASLRLKGRFYVVPDAAEEADRDDEVAGSIRWLKAYDLPRIEHLLRYWERVIRTTTARRLDAWFRAGEPARVTAAEMRVLHDRQARRALTAIQSATEELDAELDAPLLETIEAVPDNSRTNRNGAPTSVGGR